MSDDEDLLKGGSSLLCAAAVYSPEGHQNVAKALSELLFSVDKSDQHYLHTLVERLKEPRNPTQRWPLQLINAMVNSPDDMEDRVGLRQILSEMDFIELSHELVTGSGDEVDVQVAIYDQEMKADIQEMRATLLASTCHMKETYRPGTTRLATGASLTCVCGR